MCCSRRVWRRQIPFATRETRNDCCCGAASYTLLGFLGGRSGAGGGSAAHRSTIMHAAARAPASQSNKHHSRDNAGNIAASHSSASFVPLFLPPRSHPTSHDLSRRIPVRVPRFCVPCGRSQKCIKPSFTASRVALLSNAREQPSHAQPRVIIHHPRAALRAPTWPRSRGALAP